MKRKRILWKLALLSAIAGVVAVLVGLRRKRKVRKPTEVITPPDFPTPLSLAGLSEEEADAKRLKGQDNVIAFKPRRSPRDILRDNILTIFNLSLVGVAFVQLLLGLHWDMLLSLGIAVLNISLKVFQEILTTRRLQALERDTRPQATVIREGKARSIDPSEIVQEDVLVVGPGDQILVDGEILGENPILVDESILTGEGYRLTKRPGDLVYAGSFCISGRGAFQAKKVGDERFVSGLLQKIQSKVDERTPLEWIVERVLRVMLLLVFVMVTLILSHYLRVDEAVGLDTEMIVSRVSVIFSLAPAGLYFMIFLNYVGGVRQLARKGALVYRARSVETLAQASVLCVSLAGSRTGIGIQVEEIPWQVKNKAIAGSRLRQILGDFGHTSSSNNRAVLGLAEFFPGNQRIIREQSPFLSAYGWVAIAFDEHDLRGIYVLGETSVLENYLTAEKSDDKPGIDGKPRATSLRERFSIFGRFRRRSEAQHKDDNGQIKTNEKHIQENIGQKNLLVNPLENSQIAKKKPLRRFLNRIDRLIRRKRASEANQEQENMSGENEQPNEEIVYLFAYYPDLVELHDRVGQPQLPRDLIPLCYLHYSARVNPETVATVRTLLNSGVVPKVFSPGNPSRIAKLLEQAGLGYENSPVPKIVSGHELEGLDKDGILKAALENNLFGYVTHEQTMQMVKALADHGETVVVFGGNPSDLQAMQYANLSITSQGSSQAALSTADIVLLKEWPQALLTVMEKGQSIVNSLLDVLKLYLTQLAYLTILILAIWFLNLGFPYLSQQGAFIAIVTLTLPSLGLSLWEMPGALPKNSLNRQLAWFVTPASLTISAAGLFVYTYFLRQSNSIAYAQLALTHTLVISGLVLLVLARPPKRPGLDHTISIDQWRPVILAVALFVTYLIVASFPIAFRWFRLAHLHQAGDYVVVGLAVLTWTVTVQIIWRLFLPHSGKKNYPLFSGTIKRSQETVQSPNHQ